jgi:hypothetical protein
MKSNAHLCLAALMLAASFQSYAAQPLALHPDNPHYFLFRGKPTAIITSGEHYGAVLNPDFNFELYLDTLATDGLNCTRTWSGAYCEHPAAFNIANNTLAPLPGKFLTPWARSTTAGYANGGNKFDLNAWNPEYLARLHKFMSYASKLGVIVEMNLFCPFYEESMWKLSPMNALNNINGVGSVERTNVYTLDKHGGLLAVQDALVRKLVEELKGYDNLYYEICNEPYFGGVTLEWQHHIAEVISSAEGKLGVMHLISQNIANDKAQVSNPDPLISIFNFHYATPPDTVPMNYALNKVIGDNETGFRGTNDTPYRIEAWDFMTAGGGLFNNLDYSFIAGHEDGTYQYPASQPGGGNPDYRKQIGFLAKMFRGLDFIKMRPSDGIIHAQLPSGVTAHALAREGRDYLVFIRSGLGQKEGTNFKTRFDAEEVKLDLMLSVGDFILEWLNTKTCKAITSKRVTHKGGALAVAAPAFDDDIALLLRAK